METSTYILSDFVLKFDSLSNKWELCVAKQKKISLSYPQLLQLRNDLLKISSSQNLKRIIDTDNFTLLFVADKEHILFLDIPALLDLKLEVCSFFEQTLITY